MAIQTWWRYVSDPFALWVCSSMRQCKRSGFFESEIFESQTHLDYTKLVLVLGIPSNYSEPIYASGRWKDDPSYVIEMQLSTRKLANLYFEKKNTRWKKVGTNIHLFDMNNFFVQQ